MTGNGPARLTSALLVRKGNAAPASHGFGTQPVSSLVHVAQEERKLFAFFRSTPKKTPRRVEVTQAPLARRTDLVLVMRRFRGLSTPDRSMTMAPSVF